MRKFRFLLFCQLSYLSLAVGYNLFSIWLFQTSGESLYQGSRPWTNIVLLVLLLTPVLILGFKGKFRGYAVCNALLMLLLLYSGVLTHLFAWRDGNLERYLSAWAWYCAVAINAYGVSVGLLASHAGWQLGGASRTVNHAQ